AQDDSLVAAHVFGEHSSLMRGRVLGWGQEVAGWLVLNGRPMSNSDPAFDMDLLLDGNEIRSRTAAIFPLMDGEEAMGALALYSAELDSYDAGHLHLLERASQFASAALQHAVLYERTKATDSMDALTGLPNRRALYARFDELADCDGRTSPLALLYINVAGMRMVNEAYGYRAGDEVLAEVGRLLKRAFDEGEMIARLAGDEFVCLLPKRSAAEAIDLGRQLEAYVA